MSKVKSENLNPYEMSFCSGCLSSDRILSPLKENKDIFQVICRNILQSQVLLCWECMAILRRVRTFQKQVDDAQRILHFYCVEEYDPPTCLSNLTFKITQITRCITEESTITQCSTEEPLEVPIDIKDLIEVKKEIEDFECTEDIGNDDYDDYVEDTVEVKQEINEVPDIKKEKKQTNRKKHYRFISSLDNKNVMERVQISQRDLTEHLDAVRNSKKYINAKYKCEHCVCGWDYEKKKKSHDKKYHKKPGSFICGICTCKFLTKQALLAHVRGHYWLLKCPVCGLKGHIRREMDRHLYTHKKTVECLLCRCKFSTLALYRKHYKLLHDTFICDTCGRKWKTKRKLENHMSIHDSHVLCKLCSKTFKNHQQLRKHRALFHTVIRDENSYCVLCDKQFDNKSLYQRHVTSSVAHAQERIKKVKAKVKCPECDNVYSRKTYMMNHYRYVHVNKSKYYCEECNKQFLNRTRHVEHMKYQHEGAIKEKNKLCNICGRGFAASRTLLNHIRTHSGERPHECTYCDARFIQKHAMSLHIKYVHLKFKRRGGWHET